MILIDKEKNYRVVIKENFASIRTNTETNYYTIIENRGDIENSGYCVLNNVYVNEGMEGPFEARFLSRQSNLDTVDGYKALRVMKSESDQYYVILSLWEAEEDFHNWQNSSQYQTTHKKRGTDSGLDRDVVDRTKSFNFRFFLGGE
ncbi:antibiotic biosynthesis monooxygenase [Salinicoccus sp. ID82-1]|nr:MULTISPECIES: antibiotic biosynthesis monooxygenase [Salinicoccus]MCG1010527.1 antibiotic biosynthesis monooxygenase [Salinicoccus sp. ID82-1]